MIIVEINGNKVHLQRHFVEMDENHFKFTAWQHAFSL